MAFFKRYIVVDIETCGHDCARDFIAAPDLDAIKPAGNLKDPEKIAASIAERKAAATAEYQTSLSRTALDWNLSRIVALAYVDETGRETVMTCRDEKAERIALATFWDSVKCADGIIGFAARTFDLPTLIQRSRLLNVPHPKVDLGRYGRGSVTDLRDILTFDDARYEAIMPRSLKAFARRFGIPVEDEIGGADIPALVATGDWDGVRAHVTSDVQLTLALAVRLGIVDHVAAQTPEPVL